MYTKMVPFKDYNGKPRNMEVNFLLETRDVYKILKELNGIFEWRDSLEGEVRELSTEEVTEFFNNFETVLLAAWGKPSEDGLEFDRVERYRFEQSKLFSACMDMFLSDIGEVSKMLQEIMPKGMEDMVRKQAASLEKMQSELKPDASPEDREKIEKQIAELRKQIEEQGL